jgi:hypothetical protein
MDTKGMVMIAAANRTFVSSFFCEKEEDSCWKWNTINMVVGLN